VFSGGGDKERSLYPLAEMPQHPFRTSGRKVHGSGTQGHGVKKMTVLIEELKNLFCRGTAVKMFSAALIKKSHVLLKGAAELFKGRICVYLFKTHSRLQTLCLILTAAKHKIIEDIINIPQKKRLGHGGRFLSFQLGSVTDP
jgi:hypothetical protein